MAKILADTDRTVNAGVKVVEEGFIKNRGTKENPGAQP
jgi:hypothetical protein